LTEQPHGLWRTRELDAKDAAREADWAEAEAAYALDYAEWAVNNAQLTMLDAIDARAYADELARRPAPNHALHGRHDASPSGISSRAGLVEVGTGTRGDDRLRRTTHHRRTNRHQGVQPKDFHT
jgi:hypothetical protein